MAKQSYTTGQVLTAAQMTTLQANDYNQTVSAKVASYVLVATDAGTRITMSNASATTITVNTALFTAGDTLTISNIGAGVCTITAGTATVSTAGSLALSQYESGTLYFTSTGVSIFFGANPGDITGVTAGTGISGGGTSGTVTVAIDATVATLTGSQTLTNKTLTSPALTTPTISTLTTNGDLLYGTGSGALARLGIGTTGQVVTVASGLPSWATPSSGVTFAGVSLYNSTSVSAANATVTTMTFDTELFDTDAYHSTSTNTGRITIPAGKAGYYLLYGQITFLASSTGVRQCHLHKNGSANELTIDALPNSASAVNDNPQVTSIQYLAVADYIEIKGYQTSGGALNMRGNVYYTSLVAQYLGA